MKTIQRLKALRKRKGWTQEQVAQLLRVKVRTLRSWEQGKCEPKPIVAWAIESFIAENSVNN